MPFDMSPTTDDPRAAILERLTILARMLLLQEIAAKSCGDQEDFRTCLWSDVMKDGRLLRMGLDKYVTMSHQRPTGAAVYFFSPPGEICYDIFGASSIGYKRRRIARMIKALRQTLRKPEVMKETADAV